MAMVISDGDGASMAIVMPDGDGEVVWRWPMAIADGDGDRRWRCPMATAIGVGDGDRDGDLMCLPGATKSMCDAYCMHCSTRSNNNRAVNRAGRPCTNNLLQIDTKFEPNRPSAFLPDGRHISHFSQL